MKVGQIYLLGMGKKVEVVGFNEKSLKNQFFKGLSNDNKLEAMRCGLKLPLDETSNGRST
ncbi:21484_t:CDS:2 [Entrophospora sp. SA101]|nr:21484_t:CDS:2 [Entrophospora sp. SA101]